MLMILNGYWGDRERKIKRKNFIFLKEYIFISKKIQQM